MTRPKVDDDCAAAMRAVDASARQSVEPRLRQRVHDRLFGPRADGSDATRARYRIDEVIGSGAMGAVYRAYDEALGLPVALKRLTRFAEGAELAFRREFHTLVSLRHPNVVEAFDYGLDAAGPYYTMELLRGSDLGDHKRCDLSTACSLLRDIASALALLHARGFIHRDLSLRNIRVSESGRAKVIDFGLLSTAGVEAPVAGTPPYVAPETLRGLPLDRRVDLFALGAIAYFLLTGRHAFAATTLDDARRLHERPLIPPSLDRPDVTPPLNELVLGLLSVDPLARPTSAAEVIDRLSSLLPTDERAPADVAHGYLASASLVGRHQEVRALRDQIDRTTLGRGATLVLHGAAGVGKSRLLREAQIEAQLRGAVVALVSGDAGQTSYGVVRQVMGKLRVAAPEAVARAATKHDDILARIGHGLVLRDSTPHVASGSGVGDERIAIQEAIQRFLVDVASIIPLVILVDDVHLADEASLATLSLLALTAPQHRMALVAARTTDAQPKSAREVDELCDRSERLVVGGLDKTDVDALVNAVFGPIRNGAKLAELLHDSAGGSPLLCTELIRHFIDQKIVRYLDGLWVVPDDIASRALPRRLEDALDASVATLSAPARRLGQVLSVHGRAFSFEVAVSLGRPLHEETIFGAIDELATKGVLVGDATEMRFSHQGLKLALLRGIDDAERRSLHARVADVLRQKLPNEPELDGEVGNHLLCAGQRREAAPLLYRAGQRLYEAQAIKDAIPILESALQAYGDLDETLSERLELQQLLVVSGAMADRELVLRHGAEAFSRAWHHAGLDVGERAARFVGRPLGILLALVIASLRGLLAKMAGRVSRPSDAFRSALMIGGAELAVHAHLLTLDRMDELLGHLRLFDTFKSTAAHASYRLALAMRELVAGNRAGAHEHASAALRALTRDRITPLSAYDRVAAEGAIRNTRAWVALIDHDPAYEADLVAIEALSSRSFEFSCTVFRAIFHRHRGEEPIAQRFEEEAERIRVQLGALWMWEGALWQQSSLAYAFTRDMLGLKRCIEAMRRLQDTGYRLQDFIDLAQANHARERGDFETSRDILLSIHQRIPSRSVLPQHVMAAMAETSLSLGDAHGVMQWGERAMVLARDTDKGMKSMRLRLTRILALGKALEGNTKPAFTLLDDAITDAEALASPAIAGAVHEAGAVIAMESGEMDRVDFHRAGVERWFRATGTPALIARIERLRTLCTPRRPLSRRMVASTVTTMVEDEAYGGDHLR